MNNDAMLTYNIKTYNQLQNNFILNDSANK